MSKNREEIQKRLKELSHKESTVIVAKVTKQNETIRTITAEADGIEYSDIRLTAVNDETETSFILPKVGSWVLITFIENSESDAFVSAYSEIDKITIKSEHIDTVIDLQTGKIKLANKDISLIDIFSSFITELKNTIITTPAGAGSISPTTIGKLTGIENKFKQIFE